MNYNVKDFGAFGDGVSKDTVSNLYATDDARMENTHLRFGVDLMGSPAFNGIRVDAEEEHPIRDLTLRNICYTAIGGVRKEDIPAEYPQVVDKRKAPEEKGSENYYPDWSRAAFMDIRNVDGLLLEGIVLRALREDERRSVILEGCRIRKQEIYISKEAAAAEP